MPAWLHRTTVQYIPSVAEADLPEPAANYIEEPDLSSVIGWDSKYWVITGDIVSLMDASERAAVDTAETTSRRYSKADLIDEAETVLRAFAEVMLDEINTLRAQHSLTDRTLAQVKSAVRSKLDG